MTVTINGSGSINGISDPIAIASRTGSTQALPDATFTVVLFNTELVDTHSFYDPATGKFQPNIAGYYQVNWRLSINATGGNAINTVSVLRKNGVDYRQGTQLVNTSNLTSFLGSTGSCIVLLNGTTDYLEVLAYSDNVSGAGTINTGADATAVDFKLVQRT